MMSDKRYEQLLTIKRLQARDSADSGSTTPESAESKEAKLEGVISTNALDSYYSRMGESTLKNFAKTRVQE